jgi:prepilin-type N-terminal cleavage/methylation domain-containing protein/prepilin-type processing-associated H-X9-DG protein
MKRRIPGRGGFTLLELLIVVAIIALLAALLLAAIRGIKGLGLRTQCQSNMRMIGTGFQQYANANRGATSRDLFPYGPPALPPRNPVPTFAPSTGNEVIWRGDLQDAPLGPGKWIGAGLLIRDRYVVAQSDPPDTAEVYWCPAFDITHPIGIDGASGLNQFIRDYAGIRTGTNERVLRTPYLYRTSYNAGVLARGGTPLGPRLLRASQDTVSVYADIFAQSLGSFGHGDGYNILFTDNHVWFLDDAAQRLYEGAAIPIDDPLRQESTTFAGNALGWLAFDQSR